MNTTNLDRLVIELVVVVGVGFCFANACEASAKQKSPTENWVVKQLRAGEVADLNQYPKAAKLRSSFLEELLTASRTGAQVHYRGVQIKNGVVAGPVNLRGATIKLDVSLQDCVFEDAVDCSLAHFERNLFLQGTRFAGKADFTYAEIANILVANDTHFESGTEAAIFQSLKIGRDAFFSRATFAGKVDFSYSSLGGDLVGRGIQLLSDQPAAFNNMKVGGSFSLREDVISAEGTERRQSTIFNGTAGFGFTTVGGHFDADRIRFEKVSDAVTFDADSLTVTGHILLREAVCKGVADFRHTHAGGDFEVSQTEFGQPPNFYNLHVGDSAFFVQTRISGLANFAGMTYQMIDAEADDDLKELFDSHSQYAANVYANLDEAFRRRGETELAKAFYVAGKERNRGEEWRKNGSLGEWGWDYIQDKGAGYGRHLERALYWSIGFIIAGSLVFGREKWMETQNAEDAGRYQGRYRPFWYSLALFLPIVELPDAKIWMPDRNRKFRRFYMRLHIILGYLLIPIGLAAWTGIIK